MRLLLDTHIFVWWALQPGKLSDLAATCVDDDDNHLYLSIASIWETQIKIQLGKLEFDRGLPEVIHRQQDQNNLMILPITEAHIYTLEKLPSFHKDSFDRMLIAQAMAENISIVTADEAFRHYPVSTIW